MRESLSKPSEAIPSTLMNLNIDFTGERDLLFTALSLGRAIDCGNTLDFGTRKRRHR
jgi:hypothetical protein